MDAPASLHCKCRPSIDAKQKQCSETWRWRPDRRGFLASCTSFQNQSDRMLRCKRCSRQHMTSPMVSCLRRFLLASTWARILCRTAAVSWSQAAALPYPSETGGSMTIDCRNDIDRTRGCCRAVLATVTDKSKQSSQTVALFMRRNVMTFTSSQRTATFL